VVDACRRIAERGEVPVDGVPSSVAA